MGHTHAHLLKGTLELLLLEALSAGPSHGYGIARHIQSTSGDLLAVEEGSMYPALHRLEERGLVTARWTVAGSGRRVREYVLTRDGRRELEHKRRDWKAFAQAMRLLVGGKQP